MIFCANNCTNVFNLNVLFFFVIFSELRRQMADIRNRDNRSRSGSRKRHHHKPKQQNGRTTVVHANSDGKVNLDNKVNSDNNCVFNALYHNSISSGSEDSESDSSSSDTDSDSNSRSSNSSRSSRYTKSTLSDVEDNMSGINDDDVEQLIVNGQDDVPDVVVATNTNGDHDKWPPLDECDDKGKMVSPLVGVATHHERLDTLEFNSIANTRE